jgi:hypothetical protein
MMMMMMMMMIVMIGHDNKDKERHPPNIGRHRCGGKCGVPNRFNALRMVSEGFTCDRMISRLVMGSLLRRIGGPDREKIECL